MKKWAFLSTAILLLLLIFSQRPVETAKISKEQKRQMRAEQRAIRNAEETHTIDSLVMNRSWQFIPNWFQPFAGPTRMIYRNYYVNVFPSWIHVYLPFIKGYVNQYITLMNFDIPTPQNYQIRKISDGWVVSFNAYGYYGDLYTFEFSIYTPSGEVSLNISSIRYNTVNYNGSISGW